MVGANAPAAGRFPPGCIGQGQSPEERLSWMTALLPYLEQEGLYRQLDLNKGYAENLPAANTRLREFVCPRDNDKKLGDGLTHYVALAGLGHDAAERPEGASGNGFMGYDRRTTLASIPDGVSNTIALMETRHELGPWARGGTATLRGLDPAVSLTGDQPPFGSGHAGGLNVGRVDGSVTFVRVNIDPKALAAMITIAGGEQVNFD
jgi:hypothetical protein